MSSRPNNDVCVCVGMRGHHILPNAGDWLVVERSATIPWFWCAIFSECWAIDERSSVWSGRETRKIHILHIIFFSSIAHVSPRIWRQWYGNRKYICHWEERCAIHEINVMMELCEIITYGLFTGNIDPQTLQIMLNIYICSSHPIQTVLCETSITPYDRFHLYLSISSPS